MDKTKKKTVVRELDEMRTCSRKAFEMSDGTKQMIVYPKAVNVFDEEAGDFKEVDNSLVIDEDGKHYLNKKNRFVARFSNDDTNDELFAIENGIYRVGVSAKKNHKTALNRVIPAHFGKTEADFTEDKLVFSDIVDDIDYEYSVNGYGIKENIIIKKKAELYRYSFELNCTNVNAVYDEADKRVIFRDAETSAEVFTIPSPFMADADGAVSTAVSYEMRPMNNGKLMLTIIANEDWINAEERAFPVTIDPQITLAQKNSFDSYSYMSGTVSAGVLPIVGTYLSGGVISVNRMYISFENLDIPRNIKIKNASLKLYQFGEDITETAELPKICICDAQGIAVASGSTITDAIRCALDYDRIKTSATSDESVISYTFDITQFLNAASNNDLVNSTLAVKLVDESYTANNYVAFYGCSGVKNYPEITVTYETDYSVNSSAAVHTHELGRFGTGMIDLRYGNLMLESEDFAWAGNRMPVTIKHIYNSALAGYQYTNNTAIELHAANFSAMNMGYGWRLNLMQSMVSAKVTHDGVTRDGYIYVDENGAETGFIPDGDVYEDVNGAGMTYTASARELKISSETYTFDTDGRLIRIADEYDNAIVITYTDGRITTVTDGAGRDFLLSYSSTGDLMSITAPDNSVVSYTYTEGILETITYPDECKAVLTTSAANEITSVDICNNENVSLYKVYYDYNNGNVISVEEKGTRIVNGTATSEFGMCTEYAYSTGTNRTTVSTVEPSDPDAGEVTDNVVETVYTFDNDGNIISRYVYTDAAGHIGIDSEVGGIHPHGADGGVNIAANVVNLLTKTNPADWSNISASTSDYTFVEKTPENDTSAEKKAEFGSTYLNMTSHYVSGVEVGKYLNIGALLAGEYTFSAYLDVTAAGITASENQGVFLRVSDTSGNIIAESERLYKDAYGAVRVAASFTLAAVTSIVLSIVINGEGSVKVNAPQLENNPYAGAYNMIKNGSFENGFTDWQVYDGTDDDSVNTTDDFSAGHGGMMVGHADKIRKLCQIVYPKTKKSTRETFTLSGWAKGEGIVKRTRADFNDPTFRLHAVVVYTDENEAPDEFTVDFAPCTSDWQYASIQFAKTKYQQVDSILVYCEYDYNLGSVTFDNIALVRDSIEENLEKSDFVSDIDDTSETEDGAGESGDFDVEDEDNYYYDDFEEAYDAHGNALTETVFTNGEFGTIYRAFEYTPETEAALELAGNDLVAEYDSRANKTAYDVDQDTSRVTNVTDRSGNITAYEYDDAGRTTKVTNKNSDGTAIAAVDYAYDAFDNLTAIQRGDGMGYALGYNAFHKLESIGVVGRTNPLATYTYKECNGRLKKITYANGDYMTAAYNSLGQLVTEKWYNADNTLTAHYKYAYDCSGNIVRSIDILAKKEYNYMYEDGRIVRAAQCTITLSGENVTSKILDFAIHYKYDKDGKLIFKYTSEDDLMNVGGTFYEYDKNDGTVVIRNDNGKIVISHSKTDSFGRKEFEELQLSTGFVSRRFSYHTGEVNDVHKDNNALKFTPTTNLVSEILLSDGHVLAYEYDAEERITKVTDTDTTVSPNTATVTEYTYDALGQLLTETRNGVVVNTMSYDNYGNITQKNGKSYTYDAIWKDLLTSYNGQTITYDAQGNPTSYLGHTLTWEKGRQLKSYDSNIYTYNANGIRTSKTVGGVVHNYLLDGAKILRETWGENALETLWDNEDAICGIKYNGTPYYFLKNLQGDIVAITDDNGDVVARYSYDAWGVPTVVSDTTAVGIASVNPFRYRGYYYDNEIGMYYLQSRYYNPTVGRFVNSDGCFAWDIEKTVFTTNLYVYCNNNPVNEVDYTGNIVGKIIIRAIVGAIFGAAMQYLADVLQNLLDCAIDKKEITGDIWKIRSGIGDYLSSIVTGACDATLKIGIWTSIGISIASTIVGHLLNWISGRGFSFAALIKDLVWNALFSMVMNSVCKKFYPKQGAQLNKYIRGRFKVKGTNAYKQYWELLCECIEWNGFMISSFINTLRSASRKILDFVEAVLWDCVIKAFDEAF